MAPSIIIIIILFLFIFYFFLFALPSSVVVSVVVCVCAHVPTHHNAVTHAGMTVRYRNLPCIAVTAKFVRNRRTK